MDKSTNSGEKVSSNSSIVKIKLLTLRRYGEEPSPPSTTRVSPLSSRENLVPHLKCQNKYLGNQLDTHFKLLESRHHDLGIIGMQ